MDKEKSFELNNLIVKFAKENDLEIFDIIGMLEYIKLAAFATQSKD